MNTQVLNLLKIFYKDKVENLLFRNSPVFSKIGKERIEGKSANFPALAGFSGGVGGSYKNALTYANEVGTIAQWAVTPGQVFGVISFDQKEVLASKTDKGAFLRVADAKMFTSFDAVKKVLALALYGRGFGEVCHMNAVDSATYTTSSTLTITGLPEFAMMILVPGMRLEIFSAIGGTSKAKVYVKAANGNAITVGFTEGVTTAFLATDVICLADSVKGTEPLLPMGLAGWLPNVAGRVDASGWSTYIANAFFGVDRSVNQDALCGAYVNDISNNVAKNVTLMKLIRKVRRQGSKCDLIILNDEDWEDVAKAIASTDTYFTQTSTKGKRTINGGVAEMTAAFSTNYIENIYDDPFCPKGRAYVLEAEAIKFWSYSNADKVLDTGVAGNEPGTMDVNGGNEVEGKPYQLLIDDILSLQPGTAGDDGPTSVVGINVYGAYVITNTAHCGVCNFYGATDIQVA